MKLELEFFFFFLKDIHKSIITSITREGCGVGGVSKGVFFFSSFFCHFLIFIGVLKLTLNFHNHVRC